MRFTDSTRASAYFLGGVLPCDGSCTMPATTTLNAKVMLVNNTSGKRGGRRSLQTSTKGGFMPISGFKNELNSLCLVMLLVASPGGVRAATFYVNCGAQEGQHGIGAALKSLQYVPGPNTINVSGACHENVVIQSLDRLTLNAVNGASVSDASGGKRDVIAIFDSRDVAINGFTVNAGSGDGINGISCNDFSTCRLSKNVLQGATGGGGFAVYSQSQATLDGDTLQDNATGLFMRSGTKLRGGPFTSRNNFQGINIGRQAFAYIEAVVKNNSDAGIVVQWQSTLELTGDQVSGNPSIVSGNGGVGALVSQSSFARFSGSTISGNAGGGVILQDLSMGNFIADTITGNGGGTDVVCSPQYSATRGVADTGGTTNCVEP
jgi:nitrous oxidase accessory protein NosD